MIIYHYYQGYQISDSLPEVSVEVVVDSVPSTTMEYWRNIGYRIKYKNAIIILEI